MLPFPGAQLPPFWMNGGNNRAFLPPQNLPPIRNLGIAGLDPRAAANQGTRLAPMGSAGPPGFPQHLPSPRELGLPGFGGRWFGPPHATVPFGGQVEGTESHDDSVMNILQAHKELVRRHPHPDRYQPAPRQDLTGWTDEEKRQRRRDQNRDAMRRWAERRRREEADTTREYQSLRDCPSRRYGPGFY